MKWTVNQDYVLQVSLAKRNGLKHVVVIYPDYGSARRLRTDLQNRILLRRSEEPREHIDG